MSRILSPASCTLEEREDRPVEMMIQVTMSCEDDNGDEKSAC